MNLKSKLLLLMSILILWYIGDGEYMWVESWLDICDETFWAFTQYDGFEMCQILLFEQPCIYVISSLFVFYFIAWLYII